MNSHDPNCNMNMIQITQFIYIQISILNIYKILAIYNKIVKKSV